MTRINRPIAALLLVSLLAGICSCGESSGDEPNVTESDSTVETSGETTVETDRSEIEDNLPEADFEGYTFRMIGRQDNFVYQYEMGADEMNGDVINDAAYARNINVADRYNINYEITYRAWSDFTSTVSQAVLAGEDSFDLVVGAAYMLPSLAVDGLFVDWYDIPNVDFTNPWWSTDAIGELSIANHSYFAIGDFCLSNIGIMMCIFYNRTLGEDYKLDNIYEIINEGKWTYDYFNNTVKGIHSDLNGDTVMDSNDLYGFGNNIGSTLQPFVFSLGARYSEKDANDLPVYTINTEQFFNAFEQIYSLHMENEGVWADADFNVPRNMFANSQLVFNTGAVYHSATLYRDMEDVVGILPFPKADESMDKYYTCHDPNVSLMAVPITATNLDRIGIITEALSVESYKYVTPAFYETALKVKYSRDDETVQTLDLIKDGVTFDFVTLYSTGDGEKYAQIVANLLKEGSTDIASYYAENSSAAEAYFNEIIDSYLAMDE